VSRVSRLKPAAGSCYGCGNDVTGDPGRCRVCGLTDPASSSSAVWRDRGDPDAPAFGSGAFGGDLPRFLGDER